MKRFSAPEGAGHPAEAGVNEGRVGVESFGTRWGVNDRAELMREWLDSKDEKDEKDGKDGKDE